MHRTKIAPIVGSLFALAIAFGHEGNVQAADDIISDAARNHFRSGVHLLEDPDGARYEEAYSEFKAAYSQSRSPKILGNIGFCAMMLERDGEAIDAYTRYLQEVPDIDREERDQINRDLQTLKSSAVRIRVRVNERGAVLTDRRLPVRGSTITNLYRIDGNTVEVLVRPGHHQMRVKVGDRESATWDFDAVPGTPAAHEFVLLEPVAQQAEERKSPKVLPWALTVGGGLMLLGSSVTGLMAWSLTRDLEKQCPNDVCPPGSGFESDRDQARTFARITDGLLIGGGVIALSGVTWLLLSNGSNGSAAGVKGQGQPPRSVATRPTFVCNGTGCLGGFEGRF
jgi:hypothetical protein